MANSPGVVFEDILILGTRVSESTGAAPGYVRGFDIRTGALVWIFHTIPRPGEFGADTWPAEALDKAGGANAWAGMTLDPTRGIAYVPTGSAAYDFYGADRHGENLFANCLLALDARTGERRWHYQVVRHDLWDRDLPAPPNLLTIQHEGKSRDVVAQITKSGYVFVLDRDTGEPVFPMQEWEAPPSDLPGEQAWPTQPLPMAPPPFARQTFNLEDIHPLASNYDALVAEWKTLRMGSPFTPPSESGTLIFPGYDGGGKWGGAAGDPTQGYLYVNSNDVPCINRMVPVYAESSGDTGWEKGQRLFRIYCAACHGADRQGSMHMGDAPTLAHIADMWPPAAFKQFVRQGRGMMPAFKTLKADELDAIQTYLFHADEESAAASSSRKIAGFVSSGYHRMRDAEGYPAIKPPWGTLTAYDLNEGTKRWEIPLGDVPEISAQTGLQTGVENYGGPLVTKSGLIFIAATKDEKFRAFAAANGTLLWETRLPAAGYATPATYAIDGRQYVIIAAGGGKLGSPSGDAWVAYALPDGLK